MRSRDQSQAVVVVYTGSAVALTENLARLTERLGNVLTKRVTRTTRRYAPAASVVRIGPEQVAHRTLVRDLLYTVDRADMVERVDRGGQAAVQAEDLGNR
jgi:hypothetical protein